MKHFIYGHNCIFNINRANHTGSGYRAAHTGTENSSQLQFYPKFTNLPFTFAVKLDFYFDTRKDELNLSQERQRNKKFYLTFSLQLIRSVEGVF